MYEDGRGTYLFNSKDLCMISHIPELAQSGLSSFKIEGRMKTPYYIAATLKAYRAAIDDYFTCPEDYERNRGKYLAEIGKTSNRVFTTGFYFGKPEQIYESSSYERSYDFAGVVRSYDEETKIAEIEQRNKFSVGDTIEVLSPEGGIDGGFAQTITEMRNEKGAVADAPHPKELIYIKMEKPVSENYFLRKKSN
ncbi:hypothetical protein FACS1894188_12520 [Clostridia bacterium]|nr:hypothetical protein FACS1894188_12520 [Clostridia bacterium]